MGIPDCTQILAWLNDPNGGGDRPQRNAFIGRNRKFIAAMREIVEEEDQRRWNVGLASIKTITCLQVAVWDNWPRFDTKGIKEEYKTFRWGLALEAWTCRPEAVVLKKGAWQRRYIGNFKPADQVLAQAEKALEGMNAITPDYVDVLKVAISARPDWLFAMLEHKHRGDGTIFPEKQFVMIDMDAATKIVRAGRLIVGTEVLELPPFSLLDINGKPYSYRKPEVRRTKGGRKRKTKTIYGGLVLAQSRFAVPTPNDRFRTFQTGSALKARFDEMRENL